MFWISNKENRFPINTLIWRPGIQYILMHMRTQAKVYTSYTTLTDFSMKYLAMCMVYTDVGGIEYIYHVWPPLRKIIRSLKLVDYLHVQADNPWYKYYLYRLDTSAWSFKGSLLAYAKSTDFSCAGSFQFGPRREKTCLWGVQQSEF